MTPRDIVAKAWTITTNEHSLWRWGFMTAMLQTLLSAKLLIYQTWFAYSYFWLDEPIGFFKVEAVLLHALPPWIAWTIIITFLGLVVVELLFPHVATGAIVGLAAKSHRNEPVKGGLVLGLYNFFSIFAANEVFFLKNITFAITLISLALRYLPLSAAQPAIYIVVALYLVSNVLKFSAIFSEEAIVIRKIGFLAAWKKSVKLLISYAGQVVFLMLLTFIITIRIFINALIVFLVPAFVIGIGFLSANYLPPQVGWSIATILGFGIIIITSYFFAYLEVFQQTVWTITYLELSKRRELDVILE